MGLFGSIARNYKNAGANVWLFLYVVKSYDNRATLPDPIFNWKCTGLELHNFARNVRKQALKVLNENAQEYRKSIQLPADYWRLAVRMIVNNLNARPGQLLPELYEHTRDCLCLVTEAATEDFRDGDSIGIFIAADGDTWVEILSTASPLAITRKHLGNAQKGHIANRKHGDA